MRRLALIFGIGIIVVTFVCGFLAYFVTHTDPGTRIIYDGFGRQLTESPWLLRVILTQDRLWAGWAWFAGDFVVFWLGIGLGFGLCSYSLKD